MTLKALTVWQPWATLIAEGVKPYEFRRWPAPPALIGHQIVIHSAVRAVRAQDIDDIVWRMSTGNPVLGMALDRVRALPLLDRIKENPAALPLGCGMCLATLAASIPARELPELQEATPEQREDIADDVWGWKLEHVVKFMPPEPRRGAQGFWNWKE